MFGASQLTDGLVRLASEGSRDEVDRLLEVMQGQVRLMVVARLSPTPARSEAVEDLTQQVMMALAAGIRRLENRTVEGLKAFASGVVSHKVADLLRGRGAAPGSGPVASLDSSAAALSRTMPLWQLLSASGTSPPSAAARIEQVARLMLELGRLKPEHRRVITLAFFDQLPVREIASRMDISRPAASMLLIRAVRGLRRNMAGAAARERAHGASA